MVVLEGQKYACATCIKGHRSSACQHIDRPLFEIKKKGRPVTQCDHCRELRKTKQVHVKCLCESKEPQSKSAAPGRKKGRSPPSVATFPNGLTGTAHSTALSGSSLDIRHKHKHPAEPLSDCNCKSSGECNCCTPRNPTQNDKASSGDPTQAAGSCCGSKGAEQTTSPISPLTPSSPFDPSQFNVSSLEDLAHQLAQVSNASAAASHEFSRPSTSRQSHRVSHYNPYDRSPSVHTLSSRSRSRSLSHSTAFPSVSLSTPASTSPSLTDEMLTSWSSQVSTPPLTSFFPTMPDVGTCGCGVSCACPGCAEHRGPAAVVSNEPCPQACNSCFDCVGGLALPDGLNTVDEWIRNASAALPPPPSRPGSVVGAVDPTNVTTYAPSVWSSESAARAVGLVKIPALVCCGGRCKCPPNSCRCDEECCGCCDGCSCGHDHSRLRVGFAVSGERQSCCSDKPKNGTMQSDRPARAQFNQARALASFGFPTHSNPIPPSPLTSISSANQAAHPQSCCATKESSAPPSSPQQVPRSGPTGYHPTMPPPSVPSSYPSIGTILPYPPIPNPDILGLPGSRQYVGGW